MNGNLHQAEQALASRMQCRYAVLTGNGTTALWAALAALDLPGGSTVLYPALTCETAVNAAIMTGLRPTFVDVQQTTAVPTAADLVLAATRLNARAVVPTHLFGHRAPTMPLTPACPAIMDAAQSSGRPEHLQGGRAAILSFGPGKQHDLGGGGAVLTDDTDVAATCRGLLAGLANNPDLAASARRSLMVALVDLGRRTDFGSADYARQRAELIHQHRIGYLEPAGEELPNRVMDHWSHTDITDSRRLVMTRLLEEALREIPGVHLLPRYPEDAPWRFTFRVLVRRDAVITALREIGLRPTRLFAPQHVLAGLPSSEFPGAMSLADSLVNLEFTQLGNDPARTCRQIASTVARALAQESVA